MSCSNYSTIRSSVFDALHEITDLRLFDDDLTKFNYIMFMASSDSEVFKTVRPLNEQIMDR